MTEGNQGKEWDDAVADLRRDPTNPVLKTAEATARGKLNKSLRDAGQREVSKPSGL